MPERLTPCRPATAVPDATFSARLSFGHIEGWTDNGTTVPSFTYFGGLWNRATGNYPFSLAPRWVNAQSAVNPKTVFDILAQASAKLRAEQLSKQLPCGTAGGAMNSSCL